MDKSIAYSVLIILTFTLISCKGTDGHRGEERRNIPSQEELILLNKSEMQAEDARINAFIKRRGWEMAQTGTGLRYMFLSQASSTQDLAKLEQQALIDANVTLLDGSAVFSTKDSGPRWFKVGMSDVESGLHEGIQLMKVGDKARFIMPPHLAHGLVGDMQNIPPNASLLYEVTLLDLR